MEYKKYIQVPIKEPIKQHRHSGENIKVELKVIDDIRELNSYGILSGVNKDLAKNIFSYVFQKEEYKNTGYYFGKTFLGGEDIKEFDNRVKGAIHSIIKESEGLNTIAIVTHGNVHKSIFKNILNVNRKIEKIDDVSITTLDYNSDKFSIIEMKGIKLGEVID